MKTQSKSPPVEHATKAAHRPAMARRIARKLASSAPAAQQQEAQRTDAASRACIRRHSTAARGARAPRPHG